MIDKEKPGVVPAIVFIRVFDALVAYSNLTNVKSFVKSVYEGVGVNVIGVINNAGNIASFPYPCNVAPKRVEIQAGQINIHNCAIATISSIAINGDALALTLDKSYQVGLPASAFITCYYD